MSRGNTTTVVVHVFQNGRMIAVTGEILPAPCSRKMRLQRKITEDSYWTGAEENVGMFSKSRNDRNSFIYLSLFQRQVRPTINKLSYLRDNWKLFCEVLSTRCEWFLR